MIKLQRGERPEYLTDERIRNLTERFKADKKKTVWKHESIGNALLKSSSNKCSYCECKLQVEDSYMQVEHFKDKDSYPDDVVNWENLLPSCGRCNRKKWTLDVVAVPIINPYEDDPRQHLSQESFRLYAKDEKGQNSINKLLLNDDDRVVYSRFLVANRVASELDVVKKNMLDPEEVRNLMTRLLTTCQSNNPFSAFTSSTLHNNPDYTQIRDFLISSNLWDDDLSELHQNSLKLVLDKRQ